MSERALRDAGIVFERDVGVPMRDGVRLSANLFRPADGKRVPVVMSVTPYAVLLKFDAKGKEVFFCGYNGYEQDAVAKGWLRVSRRAVDPDKSRPARPYHTHERLQKLAPDEIVPVEMEILPSSTWFEAGTRLELTVLGTDGAKYPAFKHKRTVNRGMHQIHCGGRFDSYLLVPLIRGKIG